MLELSIQEILEATGGVLVQGELKRRVEGFSIDTRSLERGDFFVPLMGEKADGHGFVEEAFKKGASGTFVSQKKELDFCPSPGVVIRVQDPLLALQKVAKYYRNKMPAKIIAITGSAGKTTTKDFLASILCMGHKVLKTRGNLNNHIGLPLMLLKLRPHHRYGVLEMGMRGPGEIKLLTELSRPCLGIITNIGEAHFELLGSREAIARAKGELLEGMEPGGIAVLNGDNTYLDPLRERFPGKVINFSLENEKGFRAYDLVMERAGTHFKVLIEGKEEKFFIPLPGKQNVYNALAALSSALCLGMTSEEIREGLKAPELSGMRLEIMEASPGITIINDAYNANLSSTRASLETLVTMGRGSRTIAVLGDMLELGSLREGAHLQVGALAAELGVNYFLGLGESMVLAVEKAREKGLDNSWHFTDQVKLLKKLKGIIRPGDLVLIKGSRGMKMEQVADSLIDKDRGE